MTIMRFGKKLKKATFPFVVTMVTALLGGGCSPKAKLWSALESPAELPPAGIEHPINGAIMPSNMPPPVVFWKTNGGNEHWVCGLKSGGKKWTFEDIHPMWNPPSDEWSKIKRASNGKPIQLVLALCQNGGCNKLARRSIVHFTLSSHPVKAPLFYREVNLPFADAVRDPSKIRWRFGAIDKGTLPPIVLEHLPVCGNCHSFSKKGDLLAMDVDYANNKASYVITHTAPQMRLATSDIITWTDYHPEDKQQTFGLLSQISPDGRYVLSTVHDKSIFMPRSNLAFSQLFFPIKGIIVIYDRETKTYSPLAGADNPTFVQSNPTWSPDGQWVVFARSKAIELRKTQNNGSVFLSMEEYNDFLNHGGKNFKFDLYRIPFNNGRGGKAEPISGASCNERSNFFPKYSPDGRWIIFCQASNYMLLQPDSRLFIIPAQGGTPRLLKCNLDRMNSWHSWSPDGKWIVFSSKTHSDYTQLYLSHISEDGEAAPPVWLAHMVAPGRAANIPEFVSLPSDGIVQIHEQFLDDYSYTRAGNEFYHAHDIGNAIEKYRKALLLNPNNVVAHQRLGFLLYFTTNAPEEGIKHMQCAIQIDPRNPFAHYDLGLALAAAEDLTNAVQHLEEAIRLLPNGYDLNYNTIDMNYSLGETLYRLRRYTNCLKPLEFVVKHRSNHAQAQYLIAMARVSLGETESAVQSYEKAVKMNSMFLQIPDFYDVLSKNYAVQNRYEAAAETAEKAARIAESCGNNNLALNLKQRAQLDRSHLQPHLK